MATKKWTELKRELCAIDDVRRELTPVDALTGGDDMMIEQFIDVGADELGDLIQTDIQALYANSVGTYGFGMSYDTWIGMAFSRTDLDELRDLIVNPEVLKRTATAMAIRSLLVDYGSRSSVELGQAMNDSIGTLIKYWTAQCAERYKLAKQLLKIDLTKDGQISDFERPVTRTTLWRG